MLALLIRYFADVLFLGVPKDFFKRFLQMFVFRLPLTSALFLILLILPVTELASTRKLHPMARAPANAIKTAYLTANALAVSQTPTLLGAGIAAKKDISTATRVISYRLTTTI